MTEKEQLLTELYRDLLLNTPKTVSMDIPSNLGTGCISQTTTKQGIILSDWEMNYRSDMNVQGVNSEDYIQIIFCLNDGVSWGIMDDNHSISIQKDESCIYRGHGKSEYIWYAKNQNFLFKSIKFPVKYFQKILKIYFEPIEVQTYEKKLLSGISKVKITPAMKRILAEAKDFIHYQGGLGYLYLDSKIFEILAIYLSEVLELDILSHHTIRLSKTERSAVMEAKHIIDNDLAGAPTCEKLSQQVHLSMAKLTKGFSSMFGMTIHSYIIEQRLTKAAQFLLEEQYNIGEVAALVGYGKPSNFAAAFKRKYGVVPKNYKNTQV